MWSNEFNYVFQYSFATLILIMNYCKNKGYLDEMPILKKLDYDLLALLFIPYFAIKYAFHFPVF